jgi:hypothetical protein
MLGILKSLTSILKWKIIFVHYGEGPKEKKRDKAQATAQVSLGHSK